MEAASFIINVAMLVVALIGLRRRRYTSARGYSLKQSFQKVRNGRSHLHNPTGLLSERSASERASEHNN